MKIKKRLIAALAAFTMAIACVPSSMSYLKTSAAADDNNDDWLHVEGNKICDSSGNPVWLTGANWFGFNCTENCAHGLYAADCDDFLKNVSDRGINVIRMPISSELLVSWMRGKPDAVSSVNAGNNPPYFVINPDLVLEDGKTLKNSMEIFDVIMQKMKKYGLKVIIDVHSPASHNSGHNYNLWYYQDGAADAGNMAVGHFSSEEITYDMWKDSISWLAGKYSNDDTIVGYDLKNEPHGKRGYNGSSCPTDIAKWDNSTDLNNWRYAATDCALSLLDANPNALIFVEGVEQYPKTEKGYTYDTPDIWNAPADQSPWHGAWWGGNLRGVRDYPIELGKYQDKLVYSPHDYGPSVYAQTWFNKDFTTQSLLDDYWYDTWAYINEENIAPLLIGEWGGHMDGGDNEKWMTLLRDYMKDNMIHHTFWGLNPNSGDTGGLLSYDFMTWDEEKYALLEEALWQTDEGKFIGLDHQTPLGINGITVADYYDENSTNPTTPTDIIYGDLDNNNKVEIADLVLMNKYLTKKAATISNKNAADVNADNTVNVFDSMLIRQYLLNIINQFPAEK